MTKPPVINPPDVDPTDSPKIILASQKGNIVSDLIEISEDGIPNRPFEADHAMSQTVKGLFNCQEMVLGPSFTQVPVSKYMVLGTTLYYFDFVDTNPQFAMAFANAVNSKLGKEWYDFPQILGRALKILPFLHLPGAEDCSEEDTREMKSACSLLPKYDCNLITLENNQATPQDLLNFCLGNPAVFNFIGIYQYFS
jgi:hypothetical protein